MHPFILSVLLSTTTLQDQITSVHEARTEWEIDLNSPELDQILSQKFTYLARGTQSYAFISEDQKYVLKFIKMNHLTPHPWLKMVPPFLGGELRYKKVELRQQRFQDFFNTLHFCHANFQEETGVKFIHLNRSPSWNKTVHLTGKKGESLTFPLQNIPFIIQERAELIYHRLFRLIKNHKIEEAKQALTSLFDFLQKRGSLGLVDTDHSISNNFGFVGERVIQLDTGGLVIRNPDEKATLEEIHRIAGRIRAKIERRHPEFLPHFDEAARSYSS